MNTFTGKLDQIEAKLQTFIEGKLSRLSAIHGGYEGLSRQLVSSMRSKTISTGDGILLAPDQFTILAHPSQGTYLSEDPTLLEDLGNLLQEVGKTAGLHFGRQPVITVSPNEDMSPNRIDIIAQISQKALGNTTDLKIETIHDVHSIPKNAFLIINGREVFTLDQAVVNIGRRSSNHLAIDDPRVSRQHAQIRATHGRYEIFDLDSTSGTFINNKKIKQSLLRPGDVISLAGVNLIYGQERSSSLENTEKFVPTEHPDEPFK